MDNPEVLDYDDLGDAVREGRALYPARGYRFLLAEGDLNFKHYIVSNSIPLGRQLLEAAGLQPGKGYSLVAILPSGDFEDVLLNEPLNLRERGAERFLAFLTDREFKLTLNDQELRWGKPVINSSVLYNLAKPSEGEGIFLEVPSAQPRLIVLGELIDLSEPGIERFATAPLTFEIIVNSRPRIVETAHVTFEQIVQLAFPGQHEEKVIFSMTYRHASSMPHAGELGIGGSVKIKKKGTIFNVTRAVQS